MGAAMLASFLFLGTYLAHHLISGSTPYPGRGASRIVYFTILLTHTPLAALVVPASLLAVFHAFKKNYPAHVRITRWLLPVWLYVSITGISIYWMLYR